MAKKFSASQIAIFFINHISRKINKIAWFLHVDTNSHKLKIDGKSFGWAKSKMVVASVVMGLENWPSQE